MLDALVTYNATSTAMPLGLVRVQTSSGQVISTHHLTLRGTPLTSGQITGLLPVALPSPAASSVTPTSTAASSLSTASPSTPLLPTATHSLSSTTAVATATLTPLPKPPSESDLSMPALITVITVSSIAALLLLIAGFGILWRRCQRAHTLDVRDDIDPLVVNY